MYDRNRLLGEKPGHGIFASVALSALAAGSIAYLGMFVHNVSNARQDANTFFSEVSHTLKATGIVLVKADRLAPVDVASRAGK